tara:strand:- start:11825 stop:12040 length:216 start_codon:yes stop_codon:yes gene_type:complete
MKDSIKILTDMTRRDADMKLTSKKIVYRKNKSNPVAKMLKDPEFRQKKVADKKIYKRKVDNAGLLKMLETI